MEFYLNQKSLPMIRKCANCKYYNSSYSSCSLMMVFNAYDYAKKIYLITGDNLYCPRHNFKNEDVLKNEATIVNYKTVEEAMSNITEAKKIKDVKKTLFQ